MIAKRKPSIVSLAGLVVIGRLLWGVEAEAQDPARWEDAMRAFAAEDAASAPPTNAIVFTGSSSIALWKTVHEDMAPLTVINRGFGGSTMQDAVYWLDTLVLKHRPRAVVLYEGDNDIGYYGVTPQELLEGFKTFVSRIHAELPEARIYFLAIKPSILRWGVWPEMRRANDLIRAFCEFCPELHFIDVASPMLDGQGQLRADIFEADDLHMNARGYDIWASIVRPILLEHEGVYESGTKAIEPAARQDPTRGWHGGCEACHACMAVGPIDESARHRLRTTVTQLRTGATSALPSKYLSRADSAHLVHRHRRPWRRP